MERLISIPYLLLRGSTAAGAFAMGFVQTFVFARILDPERFSIFIITAAVGYSLWITDLGLAKIAFVNLRTPHLAGERDDKAACQAGAVILFYILLSLAAALTCFAVEALRAGPTLHEAFDLALFLLFIALNLAWFSLRTVSIAVDLFVYFERLELVRRAVNIATLLAMLVGLPLSVFLVGSNVLWAALFTVAMTKLVRRGALVLHVRGFARELYAFFRTNWHSVSRSSTGALSGLFVATFPYYIVPIVFGLGSAPIILDTVFKIFRGSCVIFAAVCDLAIPGQTRAYNARDPRRLVLTTLLAVGLCAIPALAACGVLIFGGTRALRVPAAHRRDRAAGGDADRRRARCSASILQIVAEALLQYTGYFRSLALERRDRRRHDDRCDRGCLRRKARPGRLPRRLCGRLYARRAVHDGAWRCSARSAPPQHHSTASRRSAACSRRSAQRGSRRWRDCHSRPTRTAIATSQISTPRLRLQNTAAEPKSLIRPIA